MYLGSLKISFTSILIEFSIHHCSYLCLCFFQNLIFNQIFLNDQNEDKLTLWDAYLIDTSNYYALFTNISLTLFL
jgi:hypothetical protein